MGLSANGDASGWFIHSPVGAEGAGPILGGISMHVPGQRKTPLRDDDALCRERMSRP